VADWLTGRPGFDALGGHAYPSLGKESGFQWMVSEETATHTEVTHSMLYEPVPAS